MLTTTPKIWTEDLKKRMCTSPWPKGPGYRPGSAAPRGSSGLRFEEMLGKKEGQVKEKTSAISSGISSNNWLSMRGSAGTMWYSPAIQGTSTWLSSRAKLPLEVTERPLQLNLPTWFCSPLFYCYETIYVSMCPSTCSRSTARPTGGWTCAQCAASSTFRLHLLRPLQRKKQLGKQLWHSFHLDNFFKEILPLKSIVS